MKNLAFKLLKYAALGALLVPLSIVTHELGHFAAYHFFGAENVRLHSVSVSADKEMLSSGRQAIVNIVGPLITYLTIGLAVVMTRRRPDAFWTILGLAAPLGRVVTAIYVFFRLLGYRPQPNFDEYNFSRNVGIDPLYLALATTLAVAAAAVFFLRAARRAGGFGETAAVVFALVCGIVFWGAAGGFLLP